MVASIDFCFVQQLQTSDKFILMSVIGCIHRQLIWQNPDHTVLQDVARACLDAV